MSHNSNPLNQCDLSPNFDCVARYATGPENDFHLLLPQIKQQTQFRNKIPISIPWHGSSK